MIFHIIKGILLLYWMASVLIPDPPILIRFRSFYPKLYTTAWVFYKSITTLILCMPLILLYLYWKSFTIELLDYNSFKKNESVDPIKIFIIDDNNNEEMVLKVTCRLPISVDKINIGFRERDSHFSQWDSRGWRSPDKNVISIEKMDDHYLEKESKEIGNIPYKGWKDGNGGYFLKYDQFHCPFLTPFYLIVKVKAKRCWNGAISLAHYFGGPFSSINSKSILIRSREYEYFNRLKLSGREGWLLRC